MHIRTYVLLVLSSITIELVQAKNLVADLSILQVSFTGLADMLQQQPTLKQPFDPLQEIILRNTNLRKAFEAFQNRMLSMFNAIEDTKSLSNEFVVFVEENKNISQFLINSQIVSRLFEHVTISFSKNNLQGFINATNAVVNALNDTNVVNEDTQAVKDYLNKGIIIFDALYYSFFNLYQNKLQVMQPEFMFDGKLETPESFFKNVMIKIPLNNPKNYIYNAGVGHNPILNYILRHAYDGRSWQSNA